ncbi:U-box domain-containing protein 52 [Forsythia ovata]|uniref:RING-type E3 ubiquitin transferase n=1 Tax=Forsythia ovata TaxID=205694 RepID=A0ABD1WK43_9LAMI
MLHLGTSNISTLYNASSLGTLCYIYPEYQRIGLVSPKSDFYAFEMMVLQLLTAKPAIAVSWTEIAIDDDCLVQILDPEAIIGQSTKELAILALECTELRHRDRTDLKTQILPVLEKLRVVAEKAWNLASIAPIGSPNHFICPMLKKAIEEWLAENDTSPVTNLSLLHKSLIPNYTLLSATGVEIRKTLANIPIPGALFKFHLAPLRAYELKALHFSDIPLWN